MLRRARSVMRLLGARAVDALTLQARLGEHAAVGLAVFIGDDRIAERLAEPVEAGPDRLGGADAFAGELGVDEVDEKALIGGAATHGKLAQLLVLGVAEAKCHPGR